MDVHEELDALDKKVDKVIQCTLLIINGFKVLQLHFQIFKYLKKEPLKIFERCKVVGYGVFFVKN